MAASLTLDILTPTGPLSLGSNESGSSGRCLSKNMATFGVEVPGLLGELGILPGHIPFIAPIKPGVVRFVLDGSEHRIAVGSGFLEVSEIGRVTILADRARVPGDVDEAVVTKQRDALRTELSTEKGSIDDPIVQTRRAELEWLECQLRALG